MIAFLADLTGWIYIILGFFDWLFKLF